MRPSSAPVRRVTEKFVTSAVSDRLRRSGGSDTAEELLDLDTQGIGLMLELAGMVAHPVRGLPGLAGRVGEAGSIWRCARCGRVYPALPNLSDEQ